MSDDSFSAPISRHRGIEDDAILDAEDWADDLVELRRRLTTREPADEAPAPATAAVQPNARDTSAASTKPGGRP